ncbi:hypothetical protein EGJ15_24025 [Pseudomonas sp. p99-361]|nr:hypothetical protein EGJ15_24025 [Pseudomonas sp. p99-361]
MPVTSLRMPYARPPEVAKIKIKIKIKINSRSTARSKAVRGLVAWCETHESAVVASAFCFYFLARGSSGAADCDFRSMPVAREPRSAA